MNAKEIYKIFTQDQWLDFQREGLFRGSLVDLRDGFIHLSKKEQVEGVIGCYFVGLRPLFVASFPTIEFGTTLVWEAASSGEIYPHVYGRPLRKNEIIHWTEIAL